MKATTGMVFCRPVVSQGGAAAVEFAIVCSLLLLIVFGIIEFSLLLYDKAVITNASREGARAGIVFAKDRTSTSVTAAARTAAAQYCTNLISFGGATAPTVSVTPGTNSGDPLTVVVAYRYTFLVFPNLSRIFGGGIGSSLNLSAQTIMRME